MGTVDHVDTSVQTAEVNAVSVSAPLRWRYRLLYSKLGPLKFISHLDLARLWERTFRRAKIPVAYSQGFNPRPKIQLATGLPLGYLSTFELVDLWTYAPTAPIVDHVAQIQRVSPEGITILRMAEIELGEPALQSIID